MTHPRTAATPLSVRDGYRLWAPTYEVENPTTVLDEAAVLELTPPLAGKALREAAARAGLALDVGLDQGVGPAVRSFYEAAGMLDRYEEQRGLPLVLALRFTR